MRHRVKIRKLNRSQGHYRATIANLAGALIEHKQIRTTLAKAKELRPYIEKLITHAKEDNVHKRRVVYKKLNSRKYIYELFHVIGPKNADRNGGYTRILKLGKRRGDGAEVALIQLVGFETFEVAEKSSKKPRKEAVKDDQPLLDMKADEVAVEEASEEAAVIEPTAEEAAESDQTPETDKASKKDNKDTKKEKTEVAEQPEAEAEEKIEAKTETEEKDEPEASDKEITDKDESTK